MESYGIHSGMMWNPCGDLWNPWGNVWNPCSDLWNPWGNVWNPCGDLWNPWGNVWNLYGDLWNPCGDVEWNHSTWNPPGMWGQGKLLTPSAILSMKNTAEIAFFFHASLLFFLSSLPPIPNPNMKSAASLAASFVFVLLLVPPTFSA